MDDIKYPALETIARIYRFLGTVAIIITLFVIVAGLIYVFAEEEFIGEGVLGFLGGLLGATLGSIVVLVIYGGIGALVATLNFAVAEALSVFIDIERNTRQ